MSLTLAIKFLKKNPKMERSVLESKIGYPLPNPIWDMALAAVAPPPKVAKEKIPPLVNSWFRSSQRRDECARVIANNPHMKRHDVEAVLGHKVSQDCFRRSQMAIGGVNKFQREIFDRIVATAEYLISKGRSPYSMKDKDIIDVVGDQRGVAYRCDALSSERFHKLYPEGGVKPLDKNTEKIPKKEPRVSAKPATKVKNPPRSVPVYRTFVRLSLDGSPEDYDVQFVHTGSGLVLEVRKKA